MTISANAAYKQKGNSDEQKGRGNQHRDMSRTNTHRHPLISMELTA